jgi:peptidoglycan/xylan/chitin deacetylase (PgdA/CDA1 family)
VILFLTYHKVLRGPEKEPEFYTVQAERLERQLEMIHGKGLRPLTVSELVAAGHSPNAPEFILTFDDGTVDHYDVVCPLLEKVGQKGIFFVPTAKLNRPGYLTSDMLRDMARAGHTIGLHGHEHRRLDEFGEEDIRVQMEVSRAKLEELTGTPPMIFAPPGGYMSWQLQSIAMESGARAIRTMRWGYNRQVDLTALQCIPLNRNSNEAEFGRVLEFRSQAFAYATKQIARKLVPKGLYGPLREMASRVKR